MSTWSCELLGPWHRGTLPEQLCAEMLQRLGETLLLVLHPSTGCGAEQLGSSFVQKVQGVLLGTALAMSQQGALAANSPWGCVRQSFTTGGGFLCRAVSPSRLLSSRDRDALQGAQPRATTAIKCSEHLLDEERLSKLGLYSTEKRRFWGFSLRKGETDSSQG